MRRPTTAGGFVDVPDDCGLAADTVVVTRGDTPPADGLFLAGGLLVAHDDGWSVYSCGGLLVRVAEVAPSARASFRVTDAA